MGADVVGLLALAPAAPAGAVTTDELLNRPLALVVALSLVGLLPFFTNSMDVPIE